MRTDIISSRCTQYFKIKAYLGNDGFTNLYSDYFDVRGFVVRKMQQIVDYQGIECISSGEIYIKGPDNLLQQVVGGSFVQLDDSGDVLVKAIQCYPAKASRNKNKKIGLVVLYI